MAKIIKPISVDVARENTYIYILAKQGDAVSRYLEIEMQNEGEPIDITGATSATLTAVKSDNTVTLTPGTITGGKVTVELTKQTLAIDGPVHCYLSVVAGGSILSTLDFTVSVQATNVDEDKIISSDEYTAFQAALAAIGDINTLRNDVDKAKQDAEKSATAAAKSANDAADAVETAMGNVLPIEMEDISDGSVTPEKTSFAKSSSPYETQELLTLPSTISGSEITYTLTVESNTEYYVTSGFSYTITGATLTGSSTTIDGYTMQRLDVAADTVTISMHKDYATMFAVYAVQQKRHLLIPTLLVGSDQIGGLPDESVTMPKLSAEVREALSGALKRKIVSALPSSDGAVLTAKKSSVSAQNKSKDGDLISVNLVALDNAANVAPIASTKRLRFTLTLTKASGTGSYRGGQVRLRKWRNGVETVATYNLPGAKVVDGSVAWDIPLTSFEASDTAVWADVNEIMVYVYSNNSATPADGEYTLTISDVRIVDTAVQSDLDLQTIYMVPSDDPQAENAYDEYMYIGSAWERIGSTAMDLSDYYTKADTDAAIRDAMYAVVDATANSDGTYNANGIKLSISGDHAVVGDGSRGTASAGWDGTSLIIPAYIRIPSGEVYAVTEIDANALTCSYLSMASEYRSARLYIPRTVKTYGASCVAQYYGDASGHLYIVTDSPVAPKGYDAATTTVYRLDNPLGVVDLATKAEVTAVDTKVGDIDAALDSIIAIQTSLMGGDA